MKKNLEIEYKSLLTKEEFELLLKHFHSHTIMDQTNYYFDTKDFDLLKQKANVRIRKINDSFEFTLKQSLNEGVLEHSLSVGSSDVSELSHPEIVKLLDQLNVNTPLISIGSIRTIRYLIKDEYKEICLDHSFINNYQDYEIEYELIKEHSTSYVDFMKILNNHSIQFKKAKPKFVRFIETITQ